jgi:hypothetical protein
MLGVIAVDAQNALTAAIVTGLFVACALLGAFIGSPNLAVVAVREPHPARRRSPAPCPRSVAVG